MAVAGVELSRIAWPGRLGVPARRGAQLLAASGFALAQPLFDLLGKNAEFFAVRGSTPGGIVLFAALVRLRPPPAALRPARQERRVLRRPRLDAGRHRAVRARRHVRPGARAPRR